MVQLVDQVWVGVVQIILGLVFCFIGHSAARVVLAVWGALVGFVAGSVLYVMVFPRFENTVFAAVPWWGYAIVMGLLVAWLAFAFYAVGVLLSMGAVGWGLGQLLSTAIALPDWLAWVLGLIVAAGLVMVGWTLDLPKVLLVVLTTLAGAGAVLDGIQSLVGMRLDWLSPTGWRTDLTGHTAWTVAYALLAIAGMVFQFSQRSEDSLREAYQRA